MKKQIAVVLLAAVFLMPLSFSVALAFDEIGATDEGLTAIPNAPDDYDTLQTSLKKDSLADALRRIQMLEQENRFQTKRIELLERNVNDLKNDRY